jgi:hypothetical protein
MTKRWARRANSVLCFAFTGCFFGSTAVLADSIGVATSVHPQVERVSGSSSSLIHGGESVVQDEVVKTGEGGSTKIVFTDNTNLSIGPGSRITLSHFVFNGQKNYKKATFEMAKGAFRFSTGHSEKKAYEINTPTATLGVRGTVFTVTVSDEKTSVDVESGEVEMCPVKQGSGQGNGGGGRQVDDTKCQQITAGGSGTVLASDTANSGVGANPLVGNPNSPTSQSSAQPPTVVAPTRPCHQTSCN